MHLPENSQLAQRLHTDDELVTSKKSDKIAILKKCPIQILTCVNALMHQAIKVLLESENSPNALYMFVPSFTLRGGECYNNPNSFCNTCFSTADYILIIILKKCCLYLL